jgi:hypothetical protein
VCSPKTKHQTKNTDPNKQTSLGSWQQYKKMNTHSFRGTANTDMVGDVDNEEGSLTMAVNDVIQVLRCSETHCYAFNETTGALGYAPVATIDRMYESPPSPPSPPSSSSFSSPPASSPPSSSIPPSLKLEAQVRTASTVEKLLSSSITADALNKRELVEVCSTLCRIVRANEVKLRDVEIDAHQNKVTARKHLLDARNENQQTFTFLQKELECANRTLEEERDESKQMRLSLRAVRQRVRRASLDMHKTPQDDTEKSGFVNSDPGLTSTLTSTSTSTTAEEAEATVGNILQMLAGYSAKKGSTSEDEMAEKLIWAEVDNFQLSFQSFASDIRSKQNRIDALQDKLQASQLEVKKYQDNQDQTLALVLQSKEDTIGALQEQLRATELQVKKYQDVFCKKKQERKKARRASYKGIM